MRSPSALALASIIDNTASTTHSTLELLAVELNKQGLPHESRMQLIDAKEALENAQRSLERAAGKVRNA